MAIRELDETTARRIGRRGLLQALGIGIGLVPVVKLLAACEDGAGVSGAGDVTDANDATAADSTAADSTAADSTAADSTAADSTAADSTAATAWATGGTAAMIAAASYPDPFTAGGTSCELQCQSTIGPCHTGSTERQDVSDGWDGLPVRLALRVVDAECQPIEGAIVEIWHTNIAGIYSGNINAMCNDTAEQRAATFFRGWQRSDADGRVDFDTCFPGWYSGRAIHIHFRVQTGDYAAADGAAAVVISQLFFPEALTSAIFADEPLYEDYGEPDTSLSSDNIVGGEDDKTPYVVDVARMSDGAMLASKTLVVRTDTATANCSMKGASGGGMP